MSILQEHTFLSANKVNTIYVRSRLPEGPVRATVQIIHGLAEYIDRYDEFMDYLAQAGFAVYGNDHIGHGNSVHENRWGYVGEQAGWSVMLTDILTLSEEVRSTHPNVPHFLFGHSMGSFLARSFLIKYPDLHDGCVICGTGHPARAVTMGARALAAMEIKRHSPGYYSEMLDGVMNKQYNGGYSNPRTAFDWISSDPNRVDEYIADPKCGFVPTAGLLSEILKGIGFITSRRNIEKMRKDIPIYFISGADDPVGELSQGVIRAYKAFLKAGMKDVSLKLYPALRHEIMLEVDRDEVMTDVLNWLEEHC